jgi:putative phosphotransacetylase
MSQSASAVPSSAARRAEIEKLVREIVQARVGPPSGQTAPTLLVEASARHCHLCRADLDALFGPGYELTSFRELYQPGNYAANETVAIIGPRGRMISNLRILGPLRSASQVELAFTDARSLGFDNVPVRLSGNIAGTPGCYLLGPKGMCELKEGVIRAAIHVHMSPSDADYYKVKHKDIMKLRVGGDAATVFERVHVRVDPKTRLNVHMDTDEANACGLHLTKDIELIK